MQDGASRTEEAVASGGATHPVAASFEPGLHPSLLELTFDPVVVCDSSGRVLDWNSAAQRVYGWTRAEALGKVSHELLFTEFPAPYPQVQASLASTGRWEGQLVQTTKDGQRLAVEARWAMQKGPDGEPRALFKFNRDVTETRRAEAALRESEDRLRRLFEEAPVGMALIDGNQRILQMNRWLCSLLGFPSPELVALRLEQLAHPEDAAALRRQAQSVLDGEDPQYRLEARLRTKAGEPLWVRVTMSVLQEAEGGSRFAIALVEDIMEHRRAEKARLEAERSRKELERLREVDAFKTTFINTAAHELGTPLTPIRVQLHLLKNTHSIGLSERQAHAVQVIDRNFERLGALIAEVLDVSRLQAGRLGVRLQPLDLNLVAAEAVESFKEPYRQASISLRADLTDPFYVEGDASRITQVLFNFLSNALKFTPPGGEVTVETRIEGDQAVLRVRDSGAGLTKDQIARLFQPFSQVHDTTQKTRAGTGLGLFISRGIIELHGGKIWCQSRGPAKGSTFAFQLPLRQAGPLDQTAQAQLDHRAQEIAQKALARRIRDLV